MLVLNIPEQGINIILLSIFGRTVLYYIFYGIGIYNRKAVVNILA